MKFKHGDVCLILRHPLMTKHADAVYTECTFVRYVPLLWHPFADAALDCVVVQNGIEYTFHSDYLRKKRPPEVGSWNQTPFANQIRGRIEA